MSRGIFEAVLGVASPWFVDDMDFDEGERKLAIRIDFERGSRFELPDVEGAHPVHDTVIKRYRHLNFFHYKCVLEVRVPRVKLPDDAVRQVSPPWTGKLSGFTPLFESPALMLVQQMPFRGGARIRGLSVHRVMAICERYVDLAVAEADLSEVRQLAVDGTSRACGHDYLTFAADAERRAVIFFTEGKAADTIEALSPRSMLLSASSRAYAPPADGNTGNNCARSFSVSTSTSCAGCSSNGAQCHAVEG